MNYGEITEIKINDKTYCVHNIVADQMNVLNDVPTNKKRKYTKTTEFTMSCTDFNLNLFDTFFELLYTLNFGGDIKRILNKLSFKEFIEFIYICDFFSPKDADFMKRLVISYTIKQDANVDDILSMRPTNDNVLVMLLENLLENNNDEININFKWRETPFEYTGKKILCDQITKFLEKYGYHVADYEFNCVPDKNFDGTYSNYYTFGPFKINGVPVNLNKCSHGGCYGTNRVKLKKGLIDFLIKEHLLKNHA
jgi:hypothetical protein